MRLLKHRARLLHSPEDRRSLDTQTASLTPSPPAPPLAPPFPSAFRCWRTISSASVVTETTAFFFQEWGHAGGSSADEQEQATGYPWGEASVYGRKHGWRAQAGVFPSADDPAEV
ncbi:hypothetical protein AAFF_G00434290 [Aldrovandia affinis]|uniref:Uncharacterized protein n=1 Tax=Aldrovandia affinis TaxID=143900 RepID=A0AAD7WIC6_9TELE|nr:hypothetical protein AAFF_G00434290 [Aldrovandia affinis]